MYAIKRTIDTVREWNDCHCVDILSCVFLWLVENRLQKYTSKTKKFKPNQINRWWSKNFSFY